MVIGEKFVWAHIGKTGGDFTAAAFRKIRNADLSVDWRYSSRKHETFSQRRSRTINDWTGKTRIANIRRLPSWCLSFSNHMRRNFALDFSIDEIAKGILRTVVNPSQKYLLLPTPFRNLIYTHLPLQSIEINPDSILEYYEHKSVEHWIRLEHFVEDFFRIMDGLIDIDDLSRRKISRLTVRNEGGYKRGKANHFSPQQLQRLYKACPKWAELEYRCYGSVLRIA